MTERYEGMGEADDAVQEGGQTPVYFVITIGEGKIAGIELVADPERLGRLAVSLLPSPEAV